MQHEAAVAAGTMHFHSNVADDAATKNLPGALACVQRSGQTPEVMPCSHSLTTKPPEMIQSSLLSTGAQNWLLSAAGP